MRYTDLQLGSAAAALGQGSLATGSKPLLTPGFAPGRGIVTEDGQPTDRDILASLRRLGYAGLRRVPADTWLVHFSHDAEAISREGFTQGTHPDALGPANYGRGNPPGLNFAFLAADRNSILSASNFSFGHGVNEAVVFRAPGVVMRHKDDFRQVVFWGPSAARPIYWLGADGEDSEGEIEFMDWSLMGVDGRLAPGRVRGSIFKVLASIARGDILRESQEAAGQCFTWAFREYLRRRAAGEDVALVHARVSPPGGSTYWHAWIESQGRAYDWQTMEAGLSRYAGQGWPIDIFRETFRPTDEKRFTGPVGAQRARYGHTGPWA